MIRPYADDRSTWGIPGSGGGARDGARTRTYVVSMGCVLLRACACAGMCMEKSNDRDREKSARETVQRSQSSSGPTRSTWIRSSPRRRLRCGEASRKTRETGRVRKGELTGGNEDRAGLGAVATMRATTARSG